MRRILVVAHRTLGGDHLLEEVGRRMRSGDCRVHLLVPVHHPMGAFSEASVEAEADKVLQAGLQRVRALDRSGSIDITGEVGDANPVYAVQAILNRGEAIDEIILSTLPPGPSRWLKADVPSRMAKAFPSTPVFHVLGTKEPAPA
jgi:hypothetical protein